MFHESSQVLRDSSTISKSSLYQSRLDRALSQLSKLSAVIDVKFELLQYDHDVLIAIREHEAPTKSVAEEEQDRPPSSNPSGPRVQFPLAPVFTTDQENILNDFESWVGRPRS
ncbi:uncharacterized protein I206_103620 [Kwoniella pini CBS 10737]|uniref:Uncharacterized protein n=1 Tax=Kwoniella pini CBS 10737 TaxID=1296096 RepID=A0A1B9I913_9TREE|nr:uncharacterized protein I206_01377 [Kwoniella pini CBS 10737]OCF52092.1 hypothetical protein I206_01377 [Kwoniella pini CBS 10737]